MPSRLRKKASETKETFNHSEFIKKWKALNTKVEAFNNKYIESFEATLESLKSNDTEANLSAELKLINAVEKDSPLIMQGYLDLDMGEKMPKEKQSALYTSIHVYCEDIRRFYGHCYDNAITHEAKVNFYNKQLDYHKRCMDYVEKDRAVALSLESGPSKDKALQYIDEYKEEYIEAAKKPLEEAKDYLFGAIDEEKGCENINASKQSSQQISNKKALAIIVPERQDSVSSVISENSAVAALMNLSTPSYLAQSSSNQFFPANQGDVSKTSNKRKAIDEIGKENKRERQATNIIKKVSRLLEKVKALYENEAFSPKEKLMASDALAALTNLMETLEEKANDKANAQSQNGQSGNSLR